MGGSLHDQTYIFLTLQSHPAGCPEKPWAKRESKGRGDAGKIGGGGGKNVEIKSRVSPKLTELV